jgi:hypothetical protein
MVIISRYASCHGPLAPNSERRIVATKFAVISPKCRSRLAASGVKRPLRCTNIDLACFRWLDLEQDVN